MPTPNRIAFLGFTAFERDALSACFRLDTQHEPHYTPVRTLGEADFVIADADHAPSVQLVIATDRDADTVFIGTRAPAGAKSWLRRPIDPALVMRELDAMVAMAGRPTATLPTASHGTPGARDVMAPAPAARPGMRRALLVDDSTIALRYLALKLSRYPFDIETATSSTKASHLLAQHHHEFVFLDVELGADSSLDGLALCQQIKRRHLPASVVPPVVVLVSALHSESDRVRGTFAGADAYLGKPLDDAELEKLLRRHRVLPSPQPTTPG